MEKQAQEIPAKFFGTVYLREPTPIPGSEARVIGIMGDVSLLKDTEAFGFKMWGKDSNWFAVIRGQKDSYSITGADVRAIAVHARSIEPDRNTYRLQ